MRLANQLITRENLGAWVVRCNPRKWDLAAYVESGGTAIDNWSVQDNYRSRMMKPGDSLLLWVTGADRVYERGIWGIGKVLEGLEVLDQEDAGDDESFWLDDDARENAAFSISCDLPLLLRPEAPLTHNQLVAAGIDNLEVQFQPQGSNPSWVSKDQLARIEKLLGTEIHGTGDVEVITVVESGAGFGNPMQNKLVEDAAMGAVTEYYEGAGWTIADVSAANVGWDLECSLKMESVKVEVKGASGTRPIVLLTANELRAAETQKDWYLAVVTDALGEPVVKEYFAADVVADATPYLYKAEL